MIRIKQPVGSLEERPTKSQRVLEFGCDSPTLWLSKRVKEVAS